MHSDSVNQEDTGVIKKKKINTWDEMHNVDLTPPGRGFPPHIPSLVSYRIITASTKAPFFKFQYQDQESSMSSSDVRDILRRERN